MATNSKIKKPSVKTGSRIQLTESVDYNKNPPVFSLERIQSGKYCFSALDQENKAQFAEAIFKRRTLSWSEIQNTQRHGLGIEKIDKQAIKASMPPFITEDCDHFLVFRFHGKKPMVGYRKDAVFYVLWFDHDFTLYDHG